MSTRQVERPPARTPRDPGRWLRRAWTAVASVPVFFFIGWIVAGVGLLVLAIVSGIGDIVRR